MVSKTLYLIANFGGPRHLTEIEPFLRELLTDNDVVRTGMPRLMHNYLFRKVAKKRAVKVSKEYEHMGGGSPIYRDTEALADLLRTRVDGPVMTFHRYIPDTHAQFIANMKQQQCDEIRVFPLFPQFTYATSGSVARWFRGHLPYSMVNKMRWIKSYPSHPSFVRVHQSLIREFLSSNNLQEKDTALLFTAHGIPQSFVQTGDPYQYECEKSFREVAAAFPHALSRLCYQSKFGPGEWLRPYTKDLSTTALEWNEGRPHVAFVPISFTSDHIETLCEIENDYMTEIRKHGLKAYRVPALNLRADWIDAIADILRDGNLCQNQMLVRPTP